MNDPSKNKTAKPSSSGQIFISLTFNYLLCWLGNIWGKTSNSLIYILVLDADRYFNSIAGVKGSWDSRVMLSCLFL